ncbi:CAP domain-containing protein [Duganella sp.]|uniref:CAP domain-containing protein n=1 Tax=Duganella sp. TaxID=1904440 RepID=UPI0031D3F5D1
MFKLSFLSVLLFACAARAAPADLREAGQALLDGVNQARAAGRMCGDQSYPPAPPLRWSEQLGAAALDQSSDMASRRKLDHVGSDGSTVLERSRRAGYNWSRIGENIAYGQWSAQEVLATWLASPTHCANIMNGDFTDMGAAFSRTPEGGSGVIYWAQVFGKPRS